MEKSYVTLEQKVCRVTGKTYDTKSILLDKSMKNSFEKHTVTGWGFSPEVEEKFKGGYVALVAIDIDRSTKDSQGQVTLEGAHRTGSICYIKKNVLAKIAPSVKIDKMGFTDVEFLIYLEDLQSQAK